jgi:GIY-YIG catalytic domain-containing protein
MIEIYGLCDPDTGELRYVGKAKNSQKRFKQHISERRMKRPVYAWIRRLIADGKAPALKILETVEDCEWEFAERRLIAQYRKTCNLLNLADGGAMPSQTIEQRKIAAIASNKAQKAKHPALQKLAHAKREMARLHGSFMRQKDYYYAYLLRFHMKISAADRPEHYGSWASM